MPNVGVDVDRRLNFNFLKNLPNDRPLRRHNAINDSAILRHMLRNVTNTRNDQRDVNNMRLTTVSNVGKRTRRLISALKSHRTTILGNECTINNVNRKRVTKLRQRLRIIFQLNRPFRRNGTNASLILNTQSSCRTNPLLSNRQLATYGTKTKRHNRLSTITLNITNRRLNKRRKDTKKKASVNRRTTSLSVITTRLTTNATPTLSMKSVMIVPRLTRNQLIGIRNRRTILNVGSNHTRFLYTTRRMVNRHITTVRNLAIIKHDHLNVNPIMMFIYNLIRPLRNKGVHVNRTYNLNGKSGINSIRMRRLDKFYCKGSLRLPIIRRIALLRGANSVNKLLFFNRMKTRIGNGTRLVRHGNNIYMKKSSIKRFFNARLTLNNNRRANLRIIRTTLAKTFSPSILLFTRNKIRLLRRLIRTFRLVTIMMNPSHSNNKRLTSTTNDTTRHRNNTRRRASNEAGSSFRCVVSPVPAGQLARGQHILSFLG